MRHLRLILIIATFMLSACGGAKLTTAPQATLTSPKSGSIRYYDISNFDVRDIPMRMALDDLRAQGYTVEENYLDSSSLIAEAFARGEADVAWIGNQAMWTAVSKGVKAHTVAQVTGVSSILVARSDIKTCADLDGKQMAVVNTTAITTQLYMLYFREHCPGANIELLVITENSARLAAILAGEVAASQMQSEGLINLERDAPGQFHQLIALSQEYPDVQVEGLHVRQEWAEQNPQMVKDFIKAMLLQHRKVIAEPQVLYAETARRLEISEAEAKPLADAYLAMGLWHPNGGFTQENTQATLDFLTEAEFVPGGLTLSQVVDLSYLNAVLDEIGRQ